MSSLPCDAALESEISATVLHTSGICPLPTPAPHTTGAPAQAAAISCYRPICSPCPCSGTGRDMEWMSKCQAW